MLRNYIRCEFFLPLKQIRSYRLSCASAQLIGKQIRCEYKRSVFIFIESNFLTKTKENHKKNGIGTKFMFMYYGRRNATCLYGSKQKLYFIEKSKQ